MKALANQVHVVGSRAKVDQTILASAGGDEHVFIISRDRYADYPDQPAVQLGRVLRHEIRMNVVHVHDLVVSAAFDAAEAGDGVARRLRGGDDPGLMASA